MGIIKKIKENYGYFKAGVKQSIADDPSVKAKVKENQLRDKNIREGNPEKNLKLDVYSYHANQEDSFYNKLTRKG